MNRIKIDAETLAFYYYNDGLSLRERQEVTQALATSEELQSQYQSLCSDLDKLATPADTKPRADMLERWHESIKTAAMQREVVVEKPQFHSWSFFWGITVTAAFVVGIGIGVIISGNDTLLVPAETQLAAEKLPGSPFVRSLQVHLRESEAGLSNLALQSASDKTELIIKIIEQNRLFAKAAKQNQELGVARVLRAFELVLIRIAAEETTAEDAEALRMKLMFELNVMLTKLSREPSEEQQTI